MISLSANRCASLALCHVVWMDSFLTSDVTRLRSKACRCAEVRPRCLNLVKPPAIVVACVSTKQRQWQSLYLGWGLSLSSSSNLLWSFDQTVVDFHRMCSGTEALNHWPEIFVLASAAVELVPPRTEPNQGTYLFRRHISQKLRTSFPSLSLNSSPRAFKFLQP